jgi:hypothetical protein
MKVVLLDGFARGSEYVAESLTGWSEHNPPKFYVRDWTAAEAGFSPHDVPYYFSHRAGDVFYYSVRPNFPLSDVRLAE